MKRRTLPHPVLTAILTLSTAANADMVTDQMDAARKAYDAGDLRTAVDSLNFAVASIKELESARLLKLLPEPLAGWQADPAESANAGIASMIAGINLKRRYFRPDGAEVTLSVMADSPLMPMVTMFLSSPFMLQADPGTKPYTLKGQRGITKHDPKSDEYETSLIIGNRLLIQGKGSGLTDGPAVQQYMEALDVGAIQKAFGG
jgi:hypothetical protein